MKPRQLKKMTLEEMLAALDKANKDLDRIKNTLDATVAKKVAELKSK